MTLDGGEASALKKSWGRALVAHGLRRNQAPMSVPEIWVSSRTLDRGRGRAAARRDCPGWNMEHVELV
jgi:hypothetical protein